MMSNLDRIAEELLEKYEQGLCSVEEKAQVEKHLADMEQDFVPGYEDLKESIEDSSLHIDVKNLITKRNLEMNQMLDRFERGECDLEETKTVESFLADQDRLNIPLYQKFILAERQIKAPFSSTSIIEKIEVETLLDSYEDGTISDNDLTAIESVIDSISINDIPNYKAFIEQEKAISSNINVLDLIEPEVKVVPLNPGRSWRQWGMIAASLVFVLAAIFVLKPDSSDATLANQDNNTIEIEDADEALEFTLAALGLTSKNMKKGTENMKHLKDLRHTQIYK